MTVKRRGEDCAPAPPPPYPIVKIGELMVKIVEMIFFFFRKVSVHYLRLQSWKFWKKLLFIHLFIYIDLLNCLIELIL